MSEQLRDLWREVDAIFFKAPDRSKTLSAINRLLRKNVSDSPAHYFTEDNSALRIELYSVPWLKEHLSSKHVRSEPRRLDVPLLVAQYLGRAYVLDGGNRINLWFRERDTRQHETIIIRRKVVNDG